MRKVWFVTTNDYKFREWQSLVIDSGVAIELIKLEPNFRELQTDDDNMLIEDKCLKAFAQIGRDVLIEHTSLSFDFMNGFPQGLTFWNGIGEHKTCELFGADLRRQIVSASTFIAYCNQKRIFKFEGRIRGKISSAPRGPFGFQWDPVFIPDGKTQTFAEMGQAEKNKISMRRIAVDKFFQAFREGKC